MGGWQNVESSEDKGRLACEVSRGNLLCFIETIDAGQLGPKNQL